MTLLLKVGKFVSLTGTFACNIRAIPLFCKEGAVDVAFPVAKVLTVEMLTTHCLALPCQEHFMNTVMVLVVVAINGEASYQVRVGLVQVKGEGNGWL
ncbi:hypothetical protein E2C01_033537 [Portunus trituberculatus]|uniref:Uncharacterized protein n=1 Tax=Portunus trituberculatus TaxID=210409 RepID=A0A5B7F4G5_PORTR|nr:hypothetical protein [Portunus trituberculatus]